MTVRRTAIMGFGDYPNLIASGQPVTVAMGAVASGNGAISFPAALPASNIQTEEPSEVGRVSVSGSAMWLHWFRGVSTALALSYGGAALVNGNITPWGKYRVSSGMMPGITFQAPNAVTTSNNATGGATNVDEGTSGAADGLSIGPTLNLTPWSVNLGWANLAAVPRTGNGAAFFVVVVKLHVSVDDASYRVPIYVDLFESGVYKQTLGARAVTVANGLTQTFVFPFNPASMADPHLSNVEMRFSAGVIGAPSLVYVTLETVDLVYEDASVSIAVDSGWVDSPFSASDAALAPTQSLFYAFQQTFSSSAVYFIVLDDQAQNLATTGASTGASPTLAWGGNAVPLAYLVHTPEGYGQAGVLCVGPVLFLSKGLRRGSYASGIIVEERDGSAEGGQTYGADAFRRRYASGDFILSRSEADITDDGLDWKRGHAGAFFVALEPDATAQRQRFTAFWATLKESGPRREAGSAYAVDDTMLFLKSMRFEEKL
jgi:hypothetical protein